MILSLVGNIDLPSLLFPFLPPFQIKRPYFHVKPLDRTQLKAWHSYLDWELTQLGGGDEKEVETEPDTMEGQEEEQKEGSKRSGIIAGGDRRVRILFERCLIACALYEEFWTKVRRGCRGVCVCVSVTCLYVSVTNVYCMHVSQYVHYLEPQSLDEARGVFRRACEIHLAHKHTMHLQWATFEERHGERGRDTSQCSPFHFDLKCDTQDTITQCCSPLTPSSPPSPPR